MAQPQVACQLIVFGKRAQTDLPGVLREVATAGYDGFEGGGPGAMSVSQMKALLDELGLQLAGVHTGYEGLQDLEATLDYMDALDCRLLMCSGVGSREDGLEAYERAAEVFNDVGRRCQERGIRFCYHNHAWEYWMQLTMTPCLHGTRYGSYIHRPPSQVLPRHSASPQRAA